MTAHADGRAYGDPPLRNLAGPTYAVDWQGRRIQWFEAPVRHVAGWAHIGGGRKYHLKMQASPVTLCGRNPSATEIRPGPRTYGEACSHCVRVRVRHYEVQR